MTPNPLALLCLRFANLLRSLCIRACPDKLANRPGAKKHGFGKHFAILFSGCPCKSQYTSSMQLTSQKTINANFFHYFQCHNDLATTLLSVSRSSHQQYTSKTGHFSFPEIYPFYFPLRVLCTFCLHF